MGYGDLIMVAGAAQSLYAACPDLGPVGIRTREGKLRWRPEWMGNPAIHCPMKGHAPPRQSIMAGGGYLPYLSEPLSLERGIQYSGWRARDHRGSIYLTAAEIAAVRPVAAPGPYILVEPCALSKNPNRRPDASFWYALVHELRAVVPSDIRLVQLHHAEALTVPSLVQIPNPSFRDACAVLEQAVCYIGTEGGLAHAAQALKTPAVVLWGGCVDPLMLGYPEHLNLSSNSTESPCGRLRPCWHCTQAWAALDPGYVAAGVLAYTHAHGVPRSGQRADRDGPGALPPAG